MVIWCIIFSIFSIGNIRKSKLGWYLILSSIPLWIVTGLFWFVPESVRYLHSSDQYDLAVKQLKHVADFNGNQLPSNKRLQRCPINVETGTIIDIFKCSSPYQLETLKLYSILWVCAFGYHGISFLSERYFDQLYGSGKVYQQMMITTTSEIPALIFGVLLIDKIGRKRTLMWSFFVFSICCLLLIIHSIQTAKIIGISLIFFGRMWISLAYMVIFIYFSEFYPTWVRASALGGAIALGRTAGIGTTFAAEDMTITLGMWLYGCTGIIAFMSSLLLERDTTGDAMDPSTTLNDNHNNINRNTSHHNDHHRQEQIPLYKGVLLNTMLMRKKQGIDVLNLRFFLMPKTELYVKAL